MKIFSSTFNYNNALARYNNCNIGNNKSINFKSNDVEIDEDAATYNGEKSNFRKAEPYLYAALAAALLGVATYQCSNEEQADPIDAKTTKQNFIKNYGKPIEEVRSEFPVAMREALLQLHIKQNNVHHFWGKEITPTLTTSPNGTLMITDQNSAVKMRHIVDDFYAGCTYFDEVEDNPSIIGKYIFQMTKNEENDGFKIAVYPKERLYNNNITPEFIKYYNADGIAK